MMVMMKESVGDPLLCKASPDKSQNSLRKIEPDY